MDPQRARSEALGTRAAVRALSSRLQRLPRRTHDLPEILQPRPPPQVAHDALRAGHEHRRISGTSRSNAHANVAAGDRPSNLDHLHHGVTAPSTAEVVRTARVAVRQRLQREQVRAPEALKYLKLIERRPYAAEYQRSAFSKASLVSP